MDNYSIIMKNRRQNRRSAVFSKQPFLLLLLEEVLSSGFIIFHFISLTFSPSDHPSPLLRRGSESRVPQRAIRIRIINIVSFHSDPLRGPLCTQGQDAVNIVAGVSSRLSI